MIIGGHSIIYSTNPDADRAFLRDVLELANVDAGGGWLIFALPPAELAVHPSVLNDVHEFYLMCDNVETFIDDMRQRRFFCGPVQDRGWGLLTFVTLPGGGKLGVYQPRHVRPKKTRTVKPVVQAVEPVIKKSPKPAAKKPAKPTVKKSVKPAAKKSAKRIAPTPPRKAKKS